MIRRDELLLVLHDAGAALRAGHHAVDGLIQRAVVDQLRVAARGEQCGLVEHVREVGASEAGSLAREHLEVDALGHRLAGGVHGQDLLAPLEVGSVDADLAVEAARAQQRRVEDVGTVGGRDQDDVGLRVEAVHLDEQLVERLLALVVAAAHAGTAVATDGVDLVDEDDRRAVLLGLLEQVAHAARADADEHLDEVGARDRVEGHARLTGDGAREQRLAGSGRAVQQHALGDARADRLELRRVLQELLDLVELFDGLFGARNVSEGDLRRLLGDELGLRLAELHDAVAAALHARPEEPEQQTDQQERQDEAERAEEDVGLRNLVGVLGAAQVVDRRDDLVGARLDVIELHEGAVAVEVGAQGQVDPLLAVDDLDLIDRGALEELHALLGRDLLKAGVSEQGEGQGDRADPQEDVDDRPAKEALEVHGVAGEARRLPFEEYRLSGYRALSGRALDVRRKLTAVRSRRAGRARRSHGGCGSARRSRGRSR